MVIKTGQKIFTTESTEKVKIFMLFFSVLPLCSLSPKGDSLPQAVFTFYTLWFKVFLLGTGFSGLGLQMKGNKRQEFDR